MLGDLSSPYITWFDICVSKITGANLSTLIVLVSHITSDFNPLTVVACTHSFWGSLLVGKSIASLYFIVPLEIASASVGIHVLPVDKQSELENSLKKNFKKNMMIIEKTSDLRSSLELLQKAFFTDNIQDNYTVNVVSEQEECDVSLTEDLTTIFTENLSFVEIASISSGHNPEYLTILDDELNQTPQMAVDNSVMRQFSTYIKPDNLFDALSINVFIPNKIWY